MRSAAAIALLCFAVTAEAQSTGASIAGSVTDGTGAQLVDASVTIVHTGNGRSIQLATSLRGDYRAVALLPGDYDVTAARSGFTPATRHVTLLVGTAATLDFSLKVAGVDVQTTVLPELPLVEPAQAQPSSIVTLDQIEALPVLERNFLVLAQLAPGSGAINSTVNRFAVTKFGGVADQRSGYTTLIDGGDVDDAQWGSPTINISQDAVQEFKVFRSQFDAQYGHALNAVVTVATRSGTNRLAATGFYFGRDRALNARYPFASEKPPFDEHRIGATAGGPLARDRTHAFAAIERDDVDNVRIIALPSINPLAMTENGVFPAESNDQTATLRVDHRLTPTHGLSFRYNGENQRLRRANATVVSDSSQTDVFNRSHSVVIEDTWSPAQKAANALRIHVLRHTLGTSARNATIGIFRPAGSIGQTNRDSQVVPRTKMAVADTLYLHAGRHDLKLGGEIALTTQDIDAHVFEFGVFRFNTDKPFDAADSNTWPTSFEQQQPTRFTYRSQEYAVFLQDDWRLGKRIRFNTGVRYDLDVNLRINEFYGRMLENSAMAGLERFVSPHRGTDTNNVQPRVGATWDARGDGQLIVRAASGMYVTRNRPWFQLRAMNQAGSSVVRITDRTFLRNYPDITAVLDGRTLESFIATGGPRQLGTVIPDDFVQPFAINTTAGVGWQINRQSALDVDYVHSFGDHQIGSTDRNLPAAGPISETNPRPVARFSQVVMLENFSKSWYDALEAQLRTQIGSMKSLQVSYTLSRSYLDGVDFFLTTRGTQRTPRERGYNPTDQRHNLTMAGAVGFPWQMELAAILKLVSGSPVKVQAGRDLDGDTTITGDLPAGIPITVGRERIDESLTAINAFRATLALGPIDRALLLLDPYRTLDLRVTKTIRLGGRHRIELLVEAFNATNHVNFRPPTASGQPEAGVSINTASFLLRTSARDARQIQWGARYRF